ncbi:MAG: hypothetical protein J7647_26880 [Cyanobacteria bacterium SBLK]|nr:hypothetical protein [Cyanobacteria bacterium SBLK]
MALPDLVNPIRRKFRELSNFVQNPVRVLSQRGRLEAQKAYENFEISRSKSKQENGRGKAIAELPPELESDLPHDGIQDTFRGNNRTFDRQERNGKIESDRNFPYHIISFYQSTKAGGIYKGTQTENEQPIFIFEYACDRIDLPSGEVEEKLRELVESFSLSPLQRDKFRLIIPTKIALRENVGDIIYAIAERPSKSWTLREHLEYIENVDRKGAISTLQVLRFLDLVLQSLWFLHHYQLRLSRETLQLGLAHGNLNLDNLLWVANEERGSFVGQNFWIYASNFQVFTDLSYLLKETAASQSEKEKDLRRLGELSFNLWLGKTETIEFLRKEKNHLFDILKEKKSMILYEFLQELEGGKFKSADIARNKLLSLKGKIEEEYRENLERDRSILPLVPLRRKKRNYWWIAIAFSGICLFLAFITLKFLGIKPSNLFGRSSESISEFTQKPAEECYIKNVEKLETFVNATQLGLIKKDSIWERILTRESLVAANNTSLEKELKQQLRMDADRIFVKEKSKANILNKLKDRSASFALMRELDDTELTENELEQTLVAYDALVFFIPFNNHYVVNLNFENPAYPLATDLEERIYRDGEIIFDRFLINENSMRIIQDAQSDRKESYDEIDYIPFEEDARTFFLEKMQQKQMGNIDSLKNWINEKLNEQKTTIPNASSLKTRAIFGKMLAEYNNNQKRSLGFGWLSMVLGQCSVYPLAYYDRQTVKDNYNRALSPQVDLCNDKGSYWGNSSEIEQYEFYYPLAVVYPKGSQVGETLEKILLTVEGQFLLREAGLIPKLNLPNTPAQVTMTEGGKCPI